MTTALEILADYHCNLHQVGLFLQDVLPKESLSLETEEQRLKCVAYIAEVTNALGTAQSRGGKTLLNAGLSMSNQDLDKVNDLEIEESIPRSESLPNISSTASQGMESQDSRYSNNYGDLDQDLSLSDFKELVIYDPITEENEDDDEQEDDFENSEGPLALPKEIEMKRCRSPPPPRRSRKRDSAALFDISVGDLPDPDLAGFLKEKHSGKQWWCILVDQHLCIFPSQDPDDIAYDVVILPCCQISLDDRLLRTPVFRLTQSGMTPWVLVAENNTELKEWIHALTTAASGGKYTIAPGKEKRTRARGRFMQGIDNIAEEEDEVVEDDVRSDKLKEEQNEIESWEQNKLYAPENTLSINNIQSSEENVGFKNDEIIAVGKNKNEQLPNEDEVLTQEIGETNLENNNYLGLEDGDETEEDHVKQQFVVSDDEMSESKPKPPTTLALTNKDKIPYIYENGDAKETLSSTPEDGPDGFKQEKEEFIDDDYDDDGFATDEFESGSSEGDPQTVSPLTSPTPGRKGKKKKRLLKWLRKKGKKDKSFSNLQEGIVLAGYINRCENNACNKRWCVIRDGKLFCYKNIKDDNTELTLELEGAEVKQVEGDDKKQFSFSIVRDGLSKIVLVAKNQKDMERWQKALRLESGFIRLASPADTSSGVYEHEEGDDMYITPLSPVGMTRVSSFTGEVISNCPTSPTSPPVSPLNTSTQDGEDDLYMEVLPPKGITLAPRRSSVEDLGPLPPPPVPPERPMKPKPVEDIQRIVKRESVCDSDVSGEFEEIYEDVLDSAPQPGVKEKTVTKPSIVEMHDSGKEEKEERTVTEPSIVELHDSGKEEPEEQALPQEIVSLPIGVEDGSVPDSAMTSSSNLMYTARACLARLNRKPQKTEMGSWCAKNNNKSQYLQVDLGEISSVHGIATQGRADFTDNGGWYVTTFYIAHSKDGRNWSSYRQSGVDKVFQGNNNPETVVTNPLEHPLNTRYLRIIPLSWHNHIALRIEVYTGEEGSRLPAPHEKCSSSEVETLPQETFSKNTAPKNIGRAPLSRKVSFDEKVQVIKDQYSERHRTAVENITDGIDERREASREEIEIDEIIQQKIMDRQKAGDNAPARHGVSQNILARRTLYESSSVNNTDSEGEREEKSRTTTPNDVTATENDVIPLFNGETSQNERQGNINTSAHLSSLHDHKYPDKEREVLEQTEKAFRNYAHQLSKGGEAIRKKRPSLVALNKINFEHPRTVEQQRQKEKPRSQGKTETLTREKASITARVEALKRRIQVAKDRKIFFSMSSANSHAFADAETEFHEAQLELAKAKKRLCEIESELQTQRVLDFRFQKTPDVNMPQSPKKELQRKNSRECKLISDNSHPNVDPKSFNPEGEKAAKGSVLSQIKAFETMKKN